MKKKTTAKKIKAKEVWKPIPGKEGYEVSNLGRICCLRFGKIRIRKLQYNLGYPKIDIRNVPYQVRRLVLEAFVGPCPPKMVAKCKLKSRKEARLKYLYWGFMADGQNPIRNSKLKHFQIRKIRTLLSKGMPQSQIASKYNVCSMTINRISRGESWSNIQ